MENPTPKFYHNRWDDYHLADPWTKPGKCDMLSLSVTVAVTPLLIWYMVLSDTV